MIQVEVMAGKIEMNLPADESEAGAEFQQETLDMIREGLLDFPLAAWIGSAEKVDIPVENDHGRIGGHDGPQALGLDQSFDFAENIGIAAWLVQAGRRHRKRGIL